MFLCVFLYVLATCCKPNCPLGRLNTFPDVSYHLNRLERALDGSGPDQGPAVGGCVRGGDSQGVGPAVARWVCLPVVAGQAVSGGQALAAAPAAAAAAAAAVTGGEQGRPRQLLELRAHAVAHHVAHAVAHHVAHAVPMLACSQGEMDVLYSVMACRVAPAQEEQRVDW